MNTALRPVRHDISGCHRTGRKAVSYTSVYGTASQSVFTSFTGYLHRLVVPEKPGTGTACATHKRQTTKCLFCHDRNAAMMTAATTDLTTITPKDSVIPTTKLKITQKEKNKTEKYATLASVFKNFLYVMELN